MTLKTDPAGPTRRHLLRTAALSALSALPGQALTAAQAPASNAPASNAPASNAPAAPESGRSELPLPAIGSTIDLPSRIDLLDGGRFDAKAREGRSIVLYWWASWCPFCAVQSPLMEKLWKQHQDRGLTVLGLSIDRSPEPAASYLKRKGYTFPSAWLSPQLAARLPKPKGLPVVVMLSPDGRVVAAEAGQMFEEDVMALADHAPKSR